MTGGVIWPCEIGVQDNAVYYTANQRVRKMCKHYTTLKREIDHDTEANCGHSLSLHSCCFLFVASIPGGTSCFTILKAARRSRANLQDASFTLFAGCEFLIYFLPTSSPRIKSSFNVDRSWRSWVVASQQSLPSRRSTSSFIAAPKG